MSFSGATNDLPAEGSGMDMSDYGREQRTAAAQLPLMESVGDAASEAILAPERKIAGFFAQDQQASRARLDQQFNVDPTADPGGALIDPKEWQTKYPDLGLTFTPDMGVAQAQLLVDKQSEALRRQYVLDHSPNTAFAKTARTLTGFAVSALDPLNLAAMFVPGVGEIRAGLWAAKLGMGETAARVIEGASAGAAGMTALTPIDAAYAQAYQEHYGPMDAFANVAFGTVLGGGLHAGFGALSDFLSRAAPETRDAAMRAAVAQAAEGRPVDVEPVLASDPGLAQAPQIGTAEPGALDSLPVINQQDFALAGREAQLKDDVAKLDQHLGTFADRAKAIPEENPEAVAKLKDLGDVETQLKAEDLSPELQRALGTRRDEILTDTTPEALRAQAQPTADRAALTGEQQGVQVQRDNSARMLADVQAQRRQIAAQAALGPYARASIDRARQNSLDFANGREPSTVAATPETVASAEATIKAGDDPAAELADAQSRVQAYKAQGIISDEEHTAFSDANAAADEAAKARTDAAGAAARCLFLHP